MANSYDPNQNNPYGNTYQNQGQGQYGGNYPQQYGGQPGSMYNGQQGNYNQMYQQQMNQQQMNRGMFGMNQPQYAPGQQAGYGASAVDANMILTRSFLFMFIALLITGITALLVANSFNENGALGRLVYGSRFGFLVFIIAEFAVVIACNVAMKKNNLVLSGILFFLYSVINGLTLSVIFLAYTKSSITSVFFVAAGIFAVMAILGATTKIDLTKLGVICIIGLFGVVIASLINIFIGSKTMTTVICAIGVVIFVGLTAYDVQKIKRLAATNTGYDPNVLGLYGAMELYLDFINLFLYLLRLFGKSNN